MNLFFANHTIQCGSVIRTPHLYQEFNKIMENNRAIK